MMRLLLIWLLAWFPISGPSEVAYGPAIITGYPDAIYMDINALTQVFTQKIKRWPSGEMIIVYTKPLESMEHQDFVQNVLRLSTYQYREMRQSEVTAGNAVPPKEVRSDEEMVARVENTPNAIGYINFKVIINGKKVRVLY